MSTAKANKHIEIVRSGTASLKWQKACEKIRQVLEHRYLRVGVTVIDHIDNLESLVIEQPDLVFLRMKNLPRQQTLGQDSTANLWLAEYFDEHSLAYTGSTTNAIKLDFNKAKAKQLVEAAGLPTSRFFTAKPGQYRSASELPLGFPLFIKPLDAGDGRGIAADSVVRDFPAFERKVQSITADFISGALVEKYLPGREFSVAILETGYLYEQKVMPVELIAQRNIHGDRILSKNIKLADEEAVIPIPQGVLRNKILQLGSKVFNVLGGRDYGRIDIRMDEHGEPYFLEANLIPGLANGYFARACLLNENMSYEEMILAIAELGLARSTDTEKLTDLELATFSNP